MNIKERVELHILRIQQGATEMEAGINEIINEIRIWNDSRRSSSK